MATLKQLVDETTNIKNDIVTCHTKLKEKLVEGGIEVVPQDKLITLVDKVKIGGAGIKILTGSELPLEVTNNAIFLKDIETLGNVYILESRPEMAENDVYIKSSTSSSEGTKLVVGDDKINGTIYISDVVQMVNNELGIKDAWVGVDGEWKQISFTEYIIFSNDENKLGSDVKENWVKNTYNSPGLIYTYIEINQNPKTLHASLELSENYPTKRETFVRYFIKNKIDLTPFRYIFFNISKIVFSYPANVAVGVLSPSGDKSPVAAKIIESTRAETREGELVKLDISNINGEQHIFLKVGVGKEGREYSDLKSEIFVDKIYLN